MTIQIELIAFKDPLELFEYDAAGEIVYEGTVSIDHSMRLGEMFGNYIRIPFENIQVTRSNYSQFGKVKVKVIIQDYQEFEDVCEPILLFEE